MAGRKIIMQKVKDLISRVVNWVRTTCNTLHNTRVGNEVAAWICLVSACVLWVIHYVCTSVFWIVGNGVAPFIILTISSIPIFWYWLLWVTFYSLILLAIYYVVKGN